MTITHIARFRDTTLFHELVFFHPRPKRNAFTFFVNKVRTQFNLRGIWILNRIIGGIVMVVSAFGLVFTLMGESLY